ncbi:hypothetical protein BOX15_Mlig032350g1 [Macrostomum lignano]|uniref:Uncharacterized protein n=1 Tax=Macrostomum lignano TaxID=282301 RepID=A0A267DVS8_9PLAT|nr:hypothetical protein BOX15_Mlig012229g2 [Macrostomum lignano]PAA86591.1 hypothetical protein BOX15_Mlig032350g1 [Macrostomum lignano]
MGNELSAPIRSTPESLFSITMRSSNQLLVLNAGSELGRQLNSLVNKEYDNGVKHESAYPHDLRIFHLNDAPFHADSGQEAGVAAKRLLCVLLRHLLSTGFQPVVATDLCRKYEVSSLCFATGSAAGAAAAASAAPPCDGPVACVAFSDGCLLQLIECDNPLIQAIQRCVQALWPNCRICTEGCYQFELDGAPWTAVIGDVSARARQLLVQIVREATGLGWQLLLATHTKDTDCCLFFQHVAEKVELPQPFLTNQTFAVSLKGKDMLTVIGAQTNTQEYIIHKVSQLWRPGVSRSGVTGGSADCSFMALQLKGSPWYCIGEESAHARLLVMGLLAALRSKGWRLLSAVELARRSNDKATLVFVRGPCEERPHCCVAPVSANRLWLLQVPSDLQQATTELVKQSYQFGVEETRERPSYLELRLRQSPWGSGKSGMAGHGRQLMLCVLDLFMRRGWLPVCSVDVSSTFHDDDDSSYPLDVHSWWFAGPAAATPRASNSFKGLA